MTDSGGTPRVVFAAAASALAGLAWAGALRDWMVHLAGEASVTTWQTPAFVLAPGAAIGGVLGHAAARRAEGQPVPRTVIAAPLIFGVALLYPPNMVRVVKTGEGTGALGVALIAMAGGHAIGGRGHPAARVVNGVLASASIGAVALVPSRINPALGSGSRRVALQGAALVATFAIAATASYGERAERRSRIGSAST